MKKILFLFSAFAVIFIANSLFAQSDYGSDTKQNGPSWTGFRTGELPSSNINSRPIISQELDNALKQALIDNNHNEAERKVMELR